MIEAAYIKEVAEYGAGLMLLGVAVWFIRGVLKNYLLRQQKMAEAENTMLQDMRTQNSDLTTRNRELNDRYHAAMEQSLKMAADHTTKIMTTVDSIRNKHDEALTRFAGRIEQCEIKHARCEEDSKGLRDDLESTRTQITALMSKIESGRKRGRA